MITKKVLVDGGMFLFVVLAVLSYFFFQSFLVAFLLFVIALAFGWFRRDLYRVLPSF